MARTAVLGLPRVGPDRELKLALEAYWAGRAGEDELRETARALRRAGWERARDAGIDVIPSGDFSLYDHVLDTAWAVGAIPERFGDGLHTASSVGATPERFTASSAGAVPDAFGGRGLDAYFAAARGTADTRPLEMTKWFDTNYHHLLPELAPGIEFRLRADHWLEPLGEAAALGIETRPVVLGPATFLLLSKGLERPLDALPALVPVYEQLLRELAAAGAREVQLDEPALVLDRTEDELDAITTAIEALSAAADIDLCLATYFATLGDALERVLALPVAEVHIDLVRAPEQLEPALRAASGRLSLGVVDGRNVWVTDPGRALAQVEAAVAALGEERVTIAPSCSLLHVPYEAARETGIAPEVRSHLAFAAEKLGELRALGGRRAWERPAARTADPAVRARVAALTPADYERSAPAAERRAAQRARVPLPDLPTTTIGSYPQTAEIRAARRDLREGRLDRADYERFLERQIAETIRVQEELGLDVLVHGEAERNDMVEYFGEQLEGFAFSRHGWVQSYGSRCVKPPILFGDVSRPAPMTVRWWQAAQALTDKPVKGMLTGPVTILQWSFVRDDQPRRDTCLQIALAIRDEVADLERAGAFAIQVDEAAFREGLPLRRAEQADYLRWAVDAFRLAVGAVRADTQVHTHMCYSEFGGFGQHIARLDADVLSIEASRSGMDVPDYPNDIGPGVYDIHSPRVPSQDEIERLLEQAEARVGRERLWVNPDCGLKTRRWEEVLPALEHMMSAVRSVRARA
jgi:5-methyltetrahydropteroyltriglutamate--homocysteine methyltransferase